MKKQPLIVIVGPTASGKTGLSIELAKRYGGEIISADSRQVYRGLDVGTEKVTEEEMQGIPHYCINIASPKRAFSVEQWRRHAEKAIETITKHGNVPIVAGGTAFYVDTLVYGQQFPHVAPNVPLRKKLASKSPEELLEILQRLDDERASTVEQKNPRRLIRAIEVATALGRVPKVHKKTTHYDVHWIGINPGIDVLTERITTRFNTTLQNGLIDETKKLRKELGLSWKRINELGLEYRIIREFIRGEINEIEMKEKNIRELRKYAKRQMTWLKRNKEIQWYKNKEEVLRSFKFEV